METSKTFFIKIILITVSFISLIETLEFCDKTECVSSITQEDCEFYEVLVPKKTINNCCPGCLSGGKICDCCKEDADCLPGLKCRVYKATKKNVCSLDPDSCHQFAQIRNATQKLSWIPACKVNGDYEQKQCRGDMVSGRCFCFSKTGKRIFGWDWRHNADNMTCACSVKKYELESKGKYTTLHCQQNGNYEELQCDSGVCFCVESMTGKLQKDTFVVPESMWTKLPCYNVTLYGKQYLRECESITYAETRIRQTFSWHGTYDPAMNLTFCGYDGSYGPIVIEGKWSKCIWRDGSKLGTYTAPSTDWKQTDCACAFDEKLFALNNMPFKLSCDNQGNYEALQHQNEKDFCVDAFGYAVTDFEPEQKICDRYRYDKIQTEWYCGDGFKPCVKA